MPQVRAPRAPTRDTNSGYGNSMVSSGSRFAAPAEPAVPVATFQCPGCIFKRPYDTGTPLIRASMGNPSSVPG